jgi:hypothetical protein
VDENTLEWLDLLGKGLFWAGLAVLVLSVIGAVAIGSSSSSLPLIGELQQENRGTLAVGALIVGFASAGLLAGMGALVRLQVAARRKGE